MTVDATTVPAPADVADTTAENVQAHLLKAAKFDSGQTRTWSLYIFFRILNQAEMKETYDRLLRLLRPSSPTAASDLETEGGAKAVQNRLQACKALVLDLGSPGLMNAGLVKQRLADSKPQENVPPKPDAAASDPGAPSRAFLAWLKVLVSRNKTELRDEAKNLIDGLVTGLQQVDPSGQSDDLVSGGDGAEFLRDLDEKGYAANLVTMLQAWLLDLEAEFWEHLEKTGLSLESDPNQPPDPTSDRTLEELVQHLFGESVVKARLPKLLFYEFLRQAAPAFAPDEAAKYGSPPPVIRSEDNEKSIRRKADEKKESATPAAPDNWPDPTPITLAFTYPGLKALKIHSRTLASFPEVFKEGMAARAARLHDTGPSAPEHWEGELGLRSVDGFFTGGFWKHAPRREETWKALRAEIRAFNDPIEERGQALRACIGLLSRLLGMEIRHIELGQDPYLVKNGEVETILPRKEHFGFRDGLSQPFVDLGLGDPLPGHGTPDRKDTWSPVAPGEIFLDRDDESGESHLLPIHPDLRCGSTFLVFRKLEQDVYGFRAFLRQQRADQAAQEALAAQIIGRWRNGASLVVSPYSEGGIEGEDERVLNDFRYARDDPFGRKCPLGAHVRRANPRDIGGRKAARRHRILRRGISYGGALLPEDSRGDGEKRGLLFIAANARLDLQFEVVQADWINGGEFLGQAGLGRCPLTGANERSAQDSFLEAGAVAPVTELPRFVITRGGDYFFAPGVKALRGIAERKRFRVSRDKTPFRGSSMGDAATPSLFSEPRLKGYGESMANRRVVPVKTPSPSGKAENVAFVGRYDDVVRVLCGEAVPTPPGSRSKEIVEFSVRPYRMAARRITRGDDMLVGIEAAGPKARAHERLITILDMARDRLDADLVQSTDKNLDTTLREVVRERLEAGLRRAANARRIDLVSDIAVRASYGVIDRIFGTPGPAWLTELAAALPFSRQHVGDLPRDWLMAFRGETPDDPALTTMQIWSAVVVADLIGNVQGQQVLQSLSRQAGSEMLNHIDGIVAAARARGLTLARADARGRGQPPARGRRRESPFRLVDAFVKNESEKEIQKLYKGNRDRYYNDVSLILLEIIGSTLAVIPLTFASVMGALLKFRIDLATLPRLDSNGVARIIYEAERLNPNLAVRMRQCEQDAEFDPGEWIRKGEFVAVLSAAANLNPIAFPEPHRFSLSGVGPFDGPPRNHDNYLLFGVANGRKKCWGRDHVAMPVLEECILACRRLQGLRRVAGAGGEPQKLAGVTVGLPARFTRVVAP